MNIRKVNMNIRKVYMNMRKVYINTRKVCINIRKVYKNIRDLGYLLQIVLNVKHDLTIICATVTTYGHCHALGHDGSYIVTIIDSLV